MDSKNFLQGEWISTWTMESGVLQGSVKARSHYFEDSNVQLDFQQDFEGKLTDNMSPDQMGSMDEIAKCIIKMIRKFENKAYSQIEENL